MINLFRYDNKFFEALEKVTNIIILNFLCILFCIPIITIGASITSTYYVAMKIVRHEEEYIFKMFIKSFKENFKTSTMVWIITMIIILVLIFRNYWGHIVFFYLVIGYAVISCINSLLLNNIFNKYIN